MELRVSRRSAIGALASGAVLGLAGAGEEAAAEVAEIKSSEVDFPVSLSLRNLFSALRPLPGKASGGDLTIKPHRLPDIPQLYTTARTLLFGSDPPKIRLTKADDDRGKLSAFIDVRNDLLPPYVEQLLFDELRARRTGNLKAAGGFDINWTDVAVTAVKVLPYVLAAKEDESPHMADVSFDYFYSWNPAGYDCMPHTACSTPSKDSVDFPVGIDFSDLKAYRYTEEGVPMDRPQRRNDLPRLDPVFPMMSDIEGGRVSRTLHMPFDDSDFMPFRFLFNDRSEFGELSKIARERTERLSTRGSLPAWIGYSEAYHKNVASEIVDMEDKRGIGINVGVSLGVSISA